MRGKSVLGAVAMACGIATTVTAATVRFSDVPSNIIELQSGTLATWSVRNDAGTTGGLPTGVCDGAPGLAVHDAVFQPGSLNKTDAVDDAFMLWVDNHVFVAPNAVDVSGDTLTAGPVTLAGLEVTVEYKALQDTATLRAFIAFHNPGSSPISVPVVLGTNFGSDAHTALRGEGGNQGWRVTSDDPAAPSDPPLLLVTYGPELSTTNNSYPRFSHADDTTFGCPISTEGRQLSDSLDVPPGATMYLLQFLRLAGTNDQALAAGPTFDTNPALDSALMAGITAAQADAIVNWLFAGEWDLTGGGAAWSLDAFNGTTNLAATGGHCGTIPGIAVVDAELIDPQKGDAFDGGLLLFVGGEQLPPTASVSTDDGIVRFGPETLAGLQVVQSFTALQTSPTLRTLVSLRNPTDAPISTTVEIATNVGSDDHTLIRSTSDGDVTVSNADRWIVMSDDSPPDMSDVINTHVVAGPGALPVTPSLATTVFQCSETNGVLASYDLTVGPGEIQNLLLFNELHGTVSTAIGDATRFDITPLPSDLLVADMDQLDLPRVVNWALCRGATHTEVLCRLDGLRFDTTSAGAEGKTRDKIVARLEFALGAVEKSKAAANAGQRAAAKRGIKAASAALKVYETLLKSKKGKKVVADAIRTRLTATSAEIRAAVKKLPTAFSG